MKKAIVYFLMSGALLFYSAGVHAETKTYPIQGMTCQSCVKAIKAKVCSLPHITHCDVEIGKVTLTTDKTLSDVDVAKAVEASGDYKVAPLSDLKKKK